MIISLRGTNGAGKSTIVHRLIQEYGNGELYIAGRRKPIGYLVKVCQTPKAKSTFVVGHYEIQNGGVDTLADLNETYELIDQKARQGHDVIYEGKNMSDGALRLIGLKTLGHTCCAILLTTSLDECVASVRARGHSIKLSTIEKLYDKSLADCQRLADLGITVMNLGREDAYRQVIAWLK